MAESLEYLVKMWANEARVSHSLLPASRKIREQFARVAGRGCVREGASLERIEAWEREHGYALPEGLRCWLRRSDGFYGRGGPLVHPLRRLGR